MPCRNYYDDHPQQYFTDITEPALKKQISFAESALCATLDAFEKVLQDKTKYYDLIDCEGAGITKKELMSWHTKHKKLDSRHRLEEAASKKARALAKLTAEDMEILGVK